MGFIKKWFSRGRSDPAATISKLDAANIIKAYSDVLQTQAPKPGNVADVRLLPFSKEAIKEALIIVLRDTTDPTKIERLKGSYIRLAEWQEGVGESDQGLDISKMNLNDDTEKLARQVLAHGIDREKWQSTVIDEQEKLKQELIDLGF